MQIDFFTRTGSVSDTFSADVVVTMVGKLKEQIGHLHPEIQFETNKILLKALLTADDPKSVGKVDIVQAACAALFYLDATCPKHLLIAEHLVAVDNGSGDLVLKPFVAGEEAEYRSLIEGLRNRVSPAVP